MKAECFPTENDYDNFLGSIPTIASEFSQELAVLDSQNSSDFLSKYGHLRPDTYDVTSRSYQESPELYLGNKVCKTNEVEINPQNYLLKFSNFLQKKLKY